MVWEERALVSICMIQESMCGSPPPEILLGSVDAAKEEAAASRASVRKSAIRALRTLTKPRAPYSSAMLSGDTKGWMYLMHGQPADQPLAYSTQPHGKRGRQQSTSGLINQVRPNKESRPRLRCAFSSTKVKAAYYDDIPCLSKPTVMPCSSTTDARLLLTDDYNQTLFLCQGKCALYRRVP